MYLEIDEGYFGHPKTLDLCSRLEDDRAEVYPPRLWRWAVRSAKTGKLGKITPFAIERAVDYRPMDGRCFKALVDSGWIDHNEDGTYEIHDWMDYTGGAIARMEAKVKANKDRRDAARKRTDAGTMPASMPPQTRHDAGTMPVEIPPRQDQTRQDQTRQEGDPPSRARSTERAKRPTGHELVALFGRIRSEVFPKTLPWNTARDAKGDAAAFAGLLGDDEITDVEATMRLALEHIRDGHRAWNNPRLAPDPSFAFGAWKSGFHSLREELHKRAPPPPGSLEVRQRLPPIEEYVLNEDFAKEAAADPDFQKLRSERRNWRKNYDPNSEATKEAEAAQRETDALLKQLVEHVTP